MSVRQGQKTVATHVDQATFESVREEASRIGVSNAEFLRRLLAVYEQSRDGNTPCEHCGEPAVIELEDV